jgi:hypothetical protein
MFLVNIVIVLVITISGCNSNLPGTYVPLGKDSYRGQDIIMDSRTGQVWVMEEIGIPEDIRLDRKGLNRRWRPYVPPVPQEKISLEDRYKDMFEKNQSESPPPPPPALPTTPAHKRR